MAILCNILKGQLIWSNHLRDIQVKKCCAFWDTVYMLSLIMCAKLVSKQFFPAKFFQIEYTLTWPLGWISGPVSERSAGHIWGLLGQEFQRQLRLQSWIQSKLLATGMWYVNWASDQSYLLRLLIMSNEEESFSLRYFVPIVTNRQHFGTFQRVILYLAY